MIMIVFFHSISHYFTKIFQETFPVNILHGIPHISHDIYQFIYVKYFVFYVVIYLRVFQIQSISHDIYH